MSTDTKTETKKEAPRGTKDIQLYSLATPNGVKVNILLEELQIPYDAHTINIGKNEQFQEWFLQINPNNKIPAIVDLKGPNNAPFAVIESGAILLYLAKKYDTQHQFLPKDLAGESLVLQWMFFQAGGVGPMFGQVGHFFKYSKEDVPYAKKKDIWMKP